MTSAQDQEPVRSSALTGDHLFYKGKGKLVMSNPKWTTRVLAAISALALVLTFSGAAFAQGEGAVPSPRAGDPHEEFTGHSEGYLQLSLRVDKNITVAAGDTMVLSIIAKNVQKGEISGVIALLPIQTQFYSVAGTKSSSPNTQFVYLKDEGIQGIDFGNIGGGTSVTADITVKLKADATGGFELRDRAVAIFDNVLGGGFVESNGISTTTGSTSTADGTADAIQEMETVAGGSTGNNANSSLFTGRFFVPGEKLQIWLNTDPSTGLGVIGLGSGVASESDEDGLGGGGYAVRVRYSGFPKGNHSLVFYSTRSDTQGVGKFSVQ